MVNLLKNLLSGDKGDKMEQQETPEITNSERMTGKVFKVSGEGYGFISSKELPFTRIFFHWTALEPSCKFTDLKAGTKVSFVGFEVPNRGWRAIKIRVENDK